jgi:polygalacturonase
MMSLQTSQTTKTTKTTTSKTSKTTKATATAPPTCTVTDYASISSAVKSCTDILLSDISAPPSSTLLISKLKPSATVTLAGSFVRSGLLPFWGFLLGG